MTNNILNDNNINLAKNICEIGKDFIREIEEFELFIEKIIGKPDGYTLTSFTNDNYTIINKSNLLNSFGDSDVNNTNISFSLIGKGISIDNYILEQLVDKNCGNRKYPSVYDLVYTIFDNNSIEDRLDKDPVFIQKINSLKKNSIDFNQVDSLYSQELKMLKYLSNNNNFNKEPFTNKEWLLKQAQTQIGHYSELRHDNVLYLRESFGGCCQCYHPDLMVEPVLDFWKEFLKLIEMMKRLDKNNKKLLKFEKILLKLIIFSENLVNNKSQDEKIVEELKSIITQHYGSGGEYYDGWYPSLFIDEKDFTKISPEVSSLFTGVPDDRDNGGIIHLGTGNPQLMYIIYNNKVFLGPTYSSYQFKTEYTERLNDDEWTNKITNYKKLEF